MSLLAGVDRTTVGVAAPATVAALLERSPDGAAETVHRSRLAHYLLLPGTAPAHRRCLALLSPGAAGVPIGLRAPEWTLDVERVEVCSGRLRLDGVEAVVTRLVDTTLPALVPLEPATRTALIRIIGTLVIRIGSGPGLTPESDDELAGLLAVTCAGRHPAAGRWRATARSLVVTHLHRTATVSAALLDQALAGRAGTEFRAWARALDTSAEPAAEAALLGVGHTSGTALVRGARIALDLARRAERTEHR